MRGKPIELSVGNAHGLVLYDSLASPCARRVRITLFEKELAWDTVEIDLSRLEQRQPDYLALNPNGFVPTLAHGDRVIFESNVISEYLDEAFPALRLYPRDSWLLAQVKMWQARELAMAQDYRTLMYARLMGPIVRSTRSIDEAVELVSRSTTNPADLAWEKRVWNLQVLTLEEEEHYAGRLKAWLDRLEAALTGREWLVGDRFTQAEISVYPRVVMFAYIGLGVRVDRHPAVFGWMKRLLARPSFSASLSLMEKRLQRLLQLPVLPWLKRHHQTPVHQQGNFSRAMAIGVGGTLRRVFAVDQMLRNKEANTRPIPQPAVGRIKPGQYSVTRPMVDELPSQPLCLLTSQFCVAGARIEMLLMSHGLAFEREELDFALFAHKAPGLLELNPSGELPVLRHGDRVIFESAVIAEYVDLLGTTFSGRAWFPDDAEQLARVKMWLAVDQAMHKEFRPLLWSHAIRRSLVARGIRPVDVDDRLPPGIDAGHRKWWLDTLNGTPRFDLNPKMAEEAICLKIAKVADTLASSNFLIGDTPSFADLAWLSRIQGLVHVGISVPETYFPALRPWMDRVNEQILNTPNPKGSRLLAVGE